MMRNTAELPARQIEVPFSVRPWPCPKDRMLWLVFGRLVALLLVLQPAESKEEHHKNDNPEQQFAKCFAHITTFFGLWLNVTGNTSLLTCRRLSFILPQESARGDFRNLRPMHVIKPKTCLAFLNGETGLLSRFSDIVGADAQGLHVPEKTPPIPYE